MSTPRARSARVVHHVPGRLRIRVQGAGDAGFLEDVRRVLVGLPGVETVRLSEESSSVVIGYSRTDPDFVSRLASLASSLGFEADALPGQAGDADERELPSRLPHSHLAEGIVSTASRLDAELRRTSGGYVDLKMLVPIAACAASGLSMRRGQGTPMWLTLAIFAFNAFASLHDVRLTSKEAPDRTPANVGAGR